MSRRAATLSALLFQDLERPRAFADPWPMLDRSVKQLARRFKVVAGVQQAIDLGAVLGPLLDLVVIAIVWRSLTVAPVEAWVAARLGALYSESSEFLVYR